MKVVRNYDKEAEKKIDRILELEPAIAEMIRQEKARKSAMKIGGCILLGLFFVSVVVFFVYIFPMIQVLSLIADGTYQ